MGTGMAEAEKAYRFAEERFLAGDLDGALRSSRNAKRHFASLPALQNALAAYEVHAAARGGRSWQYAVLGVATGGDHQPVTHDAIKKRYRRLCLVLHPDKNRSAAAEGAFKLLQRAWEALAARHPPGTAPSPYPKPRPPSAGAGAQAHPRARPSRPGTPRPDGEPSKPDWWSSYFRYTPPPERTWSSFGFTPPPGPSSPSSSFNFNEWQSAAHARRKGRTRFTPPPEAEPSSSSSSFNFSAWRSSYARRKGTTYCGHCSSESGGQHGTSDGDRCHSCGTPFDPPQQSRAEDTTAPPTGTAAEPPPRDPPPSPPPPPPPPRHRDDGEKFPCPTECSRCGTPFSSVVSLGLWKLRCQACSYDAFVNVHSRDGATAF